MNKSLGLGAAAILVFCILACDSPPWSKVIIANDSPADLTVRQKLPYHSWFANPCIYSSEQWKNGDAMCTTVSHVFNMDFEGEKWVTVTIPSGGAAEIDRGRHPDIGEDPEGTLMIDRLELKGAAGDVRGKGEDKSLRNLRRKVANLRTCGESPQDMFITIGK